MIKLEQVKCDFEIIEDHNQNGLILNKKNNNIKITIYDQSLIEKIIDDNFNKKYRALLYMIMSLNSEDTTESDTELALIKIDDLRKILLSKYFNLISKELLDKYLNMLLLLEQKVPIITNNRGR